VERRDFLKLSSAFGAYALLRPADAFELKNTDLGIQLYSVRDAMFKDPKGTLTAIAGHGYKIVEPFGFDKGMWFGMKPEEFKGFVKGLGMKMPSCHHFFTSKGMDQKTGVLSDDFKRAVAASKIAGHKYFVFPYVIPEEQNEESFKGIIEMINRMSEHCKKAGLQMAYHNHAFEFQIKFKDGRSMYEHILAETNPKLLKMQMDMGWVSRAGERPLDWFKKHPGRFHLSHMKDMESTENDNSVIIGNGIVDFREIIDNKKLAGMKHWIIELEHYRNGSVADVGVCHTNLKKLLV
jgi:sugar phosphate isomerase/epimerase